VVALELLRDRLARAGGKRARVHDRELGVARVLHHLELRGFLRGHDGEARLAEPDGRLAPEAVQTDRAQMEHVRERHVAVLAGSVVGLGPGHVERHALDV
jgi:hypothetical protein